MNEEKLIKKWLANNLTDAEQEAFEKVEDYELNKKILESANHFRASFFSAVKGYDELETKLESKRVPVRKLKIYNILYRIAAVFIIGFGIYSISLYNGTVALETLASQKVSFELPDASSVTLNSVSKLSYSKYRWKAKREVKLDGEAFFKVAEGSVFDVLTSYGTVRVLGTQFNVKNRDNYFEVKCFEGVVSVIWNGESPQLTEGCTFKMINNVVTFNSTNSNEPGWLNNKSIFKSVPLYVVLNEIERQYNVTIVSQKVDIERLFTGGFIHTNIEQALETILMPFNMTYKFTSPNKITVSYSEKDL